VGFGLRDFTSARSYATDMSQVREIEVRVFSDYGEAEDADFAERAAMTKEERLRLGAQLHAFWARNYFPNARRLDRTVQIARRPRG